jgi:hypothetical protein
LHRQIIRFDTPHCVTAVEGKAATEKKQTNKTSKQANKQANKQTKQANKQTKQANKLTHKLWEK